jgi:hypothetical protein
MCGCVQMESKYATCQFHDLGKVCSWSWDMLVARRCSFSGSHVLEF